MNARTRFFVFAAALLSMPEAQADTPSATGQTGLISMPDARIAPEGSWRAGLSFMRPYQAIWKGSRRGVGSLGD